MTAKCEQLSIKRVSSALYPEKNGLYRPKRTKTSVEREVQQEPQQETVVSNELEFPHRSQEELKMIFRPRRHRDIKLTFDSEESEESEEEEGISVEELKKTDGWKLFCECLDKKMLATS